MNETGKRNPACGIDAAGLTTSGTVHYNLAAAALTEEAIRRGEARLTAHGALAAETGSHTGRSPKDKHIVRDALTASSSLVGQQPRDVAGAFRACCSTISARISRRATCSSRIWSAAPTATTACARASSPNMPGIRCSSATC